MRKLLLALLLTVCAYAQTNPVTSAFPSAVVTDDQLTYQDDFGSTTLSASVGASDLTIFITSAAGFLEPSVIALCPVGECSSGNYANAELMMVTGISGTTLTIASTGRSLGQDCIGTTTGKTFAIGSVVELVPSSCAHNRLAAEIKAIETALGANLANVAEVADFDTEAELETLLTDVTNLIVSTEINTVAKLEALAGAVNLIAATEVDTIAELEALLGGVNVLLATEIDTSAELAGVLTNETGTGSAVFNVAPSLQGVINYTGTAVDDDDCTGQQGQAWFDSTDGQFEFCNANSGAPSVPGTGGGGGGAPTDATYLTNSANASLTDEVVVNSEATLEAAIGAVDLAKVGDNVATATALAADPADCGANVFAYQISATGALTCRAIVDADIPDTITLTNLTQVTTRAYADLQGIPSTFAPAAHVLDSATHTVSGLTTGHYLRANSATTFGFAQPAFSELSGAATDAQVPNNITIDLATLATTATTANAGDSATSFFSTGTLEDARLSANVVREDIANTYGAFAQDFGAASVEAPNGTARPGTCILGQVFFDSDETAGLNWYGCTATNTWTLLGDGGGSSGYQTIDDENAPLTQRTTLNFTGAGVSCADDTDQTTCTITGGSASALSDLTDVDTTGQTSGDALLYDGVDWNPGEVMTPTNTVAGTNKFFDLGAPRTTTTTLPAGANEIPMLRHEDNCTALTGVPDGVMCFEEDANTLYVCESPEGIAGVCDAAGEWTATGGGGAETNDLETTDPPSILVNEVYIGTGTGAGAFAALSGDATMSSTGVVTVANDSHTHAISTGGTGQTTQTAAMDALSPTTTKGDLLVDNGTNVIRVAVGTNDQVLTADSAQASGVKWAAAAGGGACVDEFKAFVGHNGSSGSPAGGVQYSVTGVTSAVTAGFPASLINDTESITVTMRVPRCFTGQTLDFNLHTVWASVTGTGSMAVESGCAAHGEPASFNTAQTIATLTKNVDTSDVQVDTISGLTMTGCAAGELWQIRLTQTIGTLSADVRVIGISVYDQ